MSWSEASTKSLKILAVLAMLATLAGCSGFRPLYGADAVQPGRYAFHYGAPASRLDQIVYTEFRLRLGPESDDPDALQVTVSTSAGGRNLTQTGTAKPATSAQMVVTASLSVITPDGEVVFSGSRPPNADLLG